MKDIPILRFKWPWLLAVAAGVVILPFVCPPYWSSLFTQIFIYSILALSANILFGYAGLPSLAQAGFFGTAAYVVGILSTRYGMGFWSTFVAAIILSTFVAALCGLLVSHIVSHYFLLATMGIGMIFWGLAYRWASFTGGDNGISGIPRPDIGLPIDLSDPVAFYFFSLIFFSLVVLMMHMFSRSPLGKSLVGVRESSSRMRMLGYNVWLIKYLAWVIAAVFSALAGVLWAYYNNYVNPADLDVMAAVEAFLMVILGGPATILGPVLGSAIITFLKNFISAYTQRWLIILGAIYIIIILYAPNGLVNLVTDYVKRKKKKDVAAPLSIGANE
jgi:branched-chain amino acid transport system permease protein